MKPDLKKWNLKDRNTWVVLGLVGALLLVIAIPTEKHGKKEALQESQQVTAADLCEVQADAATILEKRLEQSLSMIDGAGKVKVMLTLKDTGEKIVEKDVTKDSGTDSMGNQSTRWSENSVSGRVSSEEMPYVSNELLPRVEGVLVIAQGGGNSNVKQNILQAVMALFPLEAHKITIVKMSMQEDRLS